MDPHDALSLNKSVVQVYPLSNYSVGAKAALKDKGISITERLERMQEKYEAEGLRRSVEGIVLVAQHNYPHVLLLQADGYWRLPGGRLRPGEGEVEGLLRKLNNKLGPTSGSTDWEIVDCVGTWWRPNFDTILYPYVPPHVTRPKEQKKLFVAQLPEKCSFAVPKNFKLMAVPLFELYDKTQRYGPVISHIPQLLSRFKINMS
ncbi:Pre-mRNA cleavage factor Im subunit 2 [Cymbomonas tetramitiformis]|uniref:Pre-mRNA cleavage factor Im 25 kDa subunit n=1 Tax=Cymbomonas tetramitiformis TaxID=36881 RepID=A0AAE0BNC7_9CHLO|nr:Pre-mRNA cleavage factor Im subunit 2 [Cymbomonas tetramitiformis]